MAKTLELSDVELQPSDSGFIGSGQREGGETVDFTVVQDAPASRIDYEAKGNRGFVQDGEMVIQ